MNEQLLEVTIKFTVNVSDNNKDRILLVLQKYVESDIHGITTMLLGDGNAKIIRVEISDIE